ncbi:uncharacterized protein FSUBG_3747 [Fusarium subglutinans]|uniref:Ankyrin n=1 Tax=Gibberella subglutinans TaxID=42677 RepID=A0A8H5Q9L7_GIBSU|nr:uncharacterized protein FSUBG_3747 [Fusarium subglutinans]KAF5609966.1 hypothetical protein FSUBG_3747 [Fusarium subglutinans]
MAEILGLASSIITIVEVAGKLGTNTIRLKRLWDEVQDVPASIRRCIEQLEILAPAIEEMDHEFNRTRSARISPAAAIPFTANLFDPEIIISEIRNWQDSNSRKQLLLRSEDDNPTSRGEGPQEEHNSGSSHAIKSPVRRDLSLRSAAKPLPQRQPGPLGSFTVQSYEVVASPSIHHVPDKARYFQARVQMPWFIQRSWDLSVLRASTGWTFQLNTWNIRPWGTGIFRAVENGQVEDIVESLKNREASIYDMNPFGKSLLHTAMDARRMESIEVLIRMGMRISDIEAEYLFGRVAVWFWNEPETSRPMELARIWQADKGIVQQDDWQDIGYRSAFWVVPNLHTILPGSESVRQVIAQFNYGHLDPAVPLELLRSGLAVAADFPPYVCSSNPDGSCSCISSSLIYEYFHALLNNEKTFHDWRRLVRKSLLGVSPMGIVHPHDGPFWNLTSILKVLWQRQFLLLPFERWIQNAVTLWLGDVAAAGINLEEYMSLELLYSLESYQDTVCKDTKVEIKPGARLPKSGPSLVILSVGLRAEDWSFSWDPCVEELSGEFWATLEDAHIKVPGAWVDDGIEDGECLMRHRKFCWFRRWVSNESKIATGYYPKEEHKQPMRLGGPEGTEGKDGESLQIRGMMTCEEFSPHEEGYWD